MKMVNDRTIYLRWLLPASSFRLPIALLPLAIEYAIGIGANFRFASLVVGALGVGELSVVAIVGTSLGPLIAHLRARSVLWLLSLIELVFVLASLVHPLLWLSLPAALLAGALTSLGSGKLREILTHRLRANSLQRYLSWDAVALEFAYLIAPLLISLQVVLVGSSGLLVVPAILGIASPLLLGADNGTSDSPPSVGRVSLRSWLWILSAAEGLVEGMVVVAIVPIGTELLHSDPFAAVAMAVLSVGSIIGGSLYARIGTHSSDIQPLTRIALLLLGLSLCLVGSALSAHAAYLLTGFLFVFGGFIAPTNGLRSYAAVHRFSPQQHGAAFSMVYASYSVGSVGAALVFAALNRALPLAGELLLASLGTALIASVYLATHLRRPHSSQTPH